MTTHIALLRGINVGGHRRLPMAELRGVLAESGYAGVRTYIASGNVLFDADAEPGAAAARIAGLIEARFGFACDVIVRTAAALGAIAAANPWPDAAAARPKLLHVLLSRDALAGDAAARLRDRARGAERIAQTADALWIDFADGAAASKLTPASIDRAAGSPTTARNWATLTALIALTG